MCVCCELDDCFFIVPSCFLPSFLIPPPPFFFFEYIYNFLFCFLKEEMIYDHRVDLRPNTYFFKKKKKKQVQEKKNAKIKRRQKKKKKKERKSSTQKSIYLSFSFDSPPPAKPKPTESGKQIADGRQQSRGHRKARRRPRSSPNAITPLPQYSGVRTASRHKQISLHVAPSALPLRRSPEGSWSAGFLAPGAPSKSWGRRPGPRCHVAKQPLQVLLVLPNTS